MCLYLPQAIQAKQRSHSQAHWHMAQHYQSAPQHPQHTYSPSQQRPPVNVATAPGPIARALMFSDPQAQHAQQAQQIQQAQHAQHAAGQPVNAYQAAPPHLVGVPYPYSPTPTAAAPAAGQPPVAQYAYIQVTFPAANAFPNACCLCCLMCCCPDS